MPDVLTDSYERRALSSITINREARQRREISTAGLIDSIKRLGVLSPIIIQRDGSLIAGERRLACCRELGLSEIPVRYADELSEIELQIIEQDENIKRADLTWQERVAATERIHQLYQAAHPAGWTMSETAEQIGVQLPVVSRYLKVAQHLGEERIASAPAFSVAENFINRREHRREAEGLEELLGLLPDRTGEVITPADPILAANFLEWAPRYRGEAFNLIHCDFPYGIGVFSGEMAGKFREPSHYDDDLKTYVSLIHCLCENLDRLLSLSGHLMFWYSDRYRAFTLKLFADLAPQLVFKPFPLIWHKSDNAGVIGDIRRSFRHIYETCLIASIGDRQLVQSRGDLYACPTDQRLHPATKPEPMLKFFMEALVDNTTRIFDPTAGSGAALRAAESLGASQVLGLELDPEVARVANGHYRTWRALRSA